jgi:hypothetical protein
MLMNMENGSKCKIIVSFSKLGWVLMQATLQELEREQKKLGHS